MKRRIAVLGGGTGSLAAVWSLTQLPGWADRYDITVYQMGWRLGGKGASGRNRAYGDRIEEHGLHVWAGIYANGFRMIRDVYASLEPDPGNPIRTWTDAFRKHSAVMLQEQIDGRWIEWPFEFPENDAIPGDGGTFPSPWEYVKMLIGWLHGHVAGATAQRAAKGPGSATDGGLGDRAAAFLASAPRDTGAALPIWKHLFGHDAAHPPDLGVHRAHDLMSAAKHLAEWLHDDAFRHVIEDHFNLLHLLEQALARLEEEVLHDLEKNDTLRRVLTLLDLGCATVKGIVKDGVLLHGFEAVGEWEWRDWLKANGARQSTVDSALVSSIYDYVFAFVGGRSNQARIEAGVATHCILRLVFTYKGAVFYEMQAGMGDIVFAPLYRSLANRGVHFRFFHKVERLELSPDRRAVQRIHVTEQATVKNPGGYAPLRAVRGVPSWPSEPDYAQLVEGERLQKDKVDLESAWSKPVGQPKVLEQGRDFDDVILGIALGAFPDVCRELIDVGGPFARMVQEVKTVQTASLQLWLDKDAAAIGAPASPRITSGYAHVLGSWADMSFLLEREGWSGAAPRFLAYFCGEFPDADRIPSHDDTTFPALERERFRAMAIQWIEANIAHLWPRAAGGGGFDWSLLHDPAGRQGTARLDAQYLRVNIEPTERYVLSLPKTAKFRLRAGDSGFTNVYLAGDWVRTSYNAGAVEAAVMAGMDAAQALSGQPMHIMGGLT